MPPSGCRLLQGRYGPVHRYDQLPGHSWVPMTLNFSTQQDTSSHQSQAPTSNGAFQKTEVRERPGLGQGGAGPMVQLPVAVEVPG